MPNRYVRESAIESSAVNSLGWQAEVFYRRLLNRVDDFGRFTANAALLRASIFPLQLDKVRETDIPRLLAECEKAGLLFVYATGTSKPSLALNKWEMGRAQKSEYPPPPADICERMQTFVYDGKHPSANVRSSDSDTDSDPDKGLELPSVLNTEPFKAKWREYVVYRRGARFKPLQPASMTKLWAALASWGHDGALVSIDQTIRNGWQGLFAPKNKPKEPGSYVSKPPANLK